MMKPIRAQNGIVLIVTLIVLVALSLTAIAMRDKMDLSALVTGSLIEKQQARNIATSSLERAVERLEDVENLLSETSVPVVFDGYHHQRLPEVSNGIPKALGNKPNAKANNVMFDAAADTGYQAALVIERLCTDSAKATASNCVGTVLEKETEGIVHRQFGNTGNINYNPDDLPPPPEIAPMFVPTYRLTVRVDGPKNSVTYAQMLLAPRVKF
jgi:Tfp pilus assembly protein PilX